MKAISLLWTVLPGAALMGAVSADRGGLRRELVASTPRRDLQQSGYPYTAQQILDLATAYIGGKDALMALDVVVIESTGETNMIFEGELPPVMTKSSEYERSTALDFAHDKIRIDEVLDPFFEAFAFFPVQSSTRIVDGNVGAQDRQTLFVFPGTMSSSAVAALKRQQLLFNPHQLLRRGQSQPSSRMFYRPGKRGKHVLGFKDDDVSRIILVVNKKGRIMRLRTTETNPLVRDIKITVKYSGWDLVGDDGIKFPRRVAMSAGIYGTMWTDNRTSVVTNPTGLPDDAFDLPNGTDADSFDPELYWYGLQTHHVEESIRNLGFTYSQQRYAPGVELAPGVYWLQSQCNSMVVCYGEGVILQEMPNNNVVADRLLSATAELCPDLPVTHAIQTHFHVDHASGSRQVVAATGADFVVGNGGLKEFWENDVFAAESRVRPDRQQELGNPIPNVVEVPDMDGSLVLVSGGDVTVTVYDTNRDPHAADATITTVESAGRIFVYEADMYAPGLGGTVTIGGARAFFDALRDHNLIDENCESPVPLIVVPAHGFVQSLEDSLVELEGLGDDVGCPPPPQR